MHGHNCAQNCKREEETKGNGWKESVQTFAATSDLNMLQKQSSFSSLILLHTINATCETIHSMRRWTFFSFLTHTHTFSLSFSLSHTQKHEHQPCSLPRAMTMHAEIESHAGCAKFGQIPLIVINFHSLMRFSLSKSLFLHAHTQHTHYVYGMYVCCTPIAFPQNFLFQEMGASSNTALLYLPHDLAVLVLFFISHALGNRASAEQCR